MTDRDKIEAAIHRRVGEWFTQQQIADEVRCTTSWVSQTMTHMGRHRFEDQTIYTQGTPIRFRLHPPEEQQTYDDRCKELEHQAARERAVKQLMSDVVALRDELNAATERMLTQLESLTFPAASVGIGGTHAS